MSSTNLQKVLDDARWLLSKVQSQEAAAGGLEQCAADLRSSMQNRSTESKSGAGNAAGATSNGMTAVNGDGGNDDTVPRPGVGDFYLTEQCRLRQLRRENDDLRQALSEHQHVLEVIMVKYRQQISTLTEARQRDKPSAVQEQQMKDIYHLATQAVSMASMMRKASSLEDDVSMTEQESLAELQYEHQALREMLEASRPFLTPKQLQTIVDQHIEKSQSQPSSAS